MMYGGPVALSGQWNLPFLHSRTGTIKDVVTVNRAKYSSHEPVSPAPRDADLSLKHDRYLRNDY